MKSGLKMYSLTEVHRIMYKKITVDGKEIPLKTNGLVPFIYKKEFKRDFFSDIMKMQADNIDMEIIYNLIWVFAKIGNKDLPDLWDWLEEFEEFPITDYINDITEMITSCISTSKKIKNQKAAAKR